MDWKLALLVAFILIGSAVAMMAGFMSRSTRR